MSEQKQQNRDVETAGERRDIPDVEIQKVMEDLKSEQPLGASAGEKVVLDASEVVAAEEETHRFDAKVDSILSILINSVYSNKDYFLRELISNANDANDKRRRSAHATGGGLDVDLKIRIIPNKANSTLSVVDNGIGMSKADLVNYLGSIANSGTKEFRQQLKDSKESDVSALIGQFGLGFYSAFLVAEQVDVVSRTGEGEQNIWSSRGPGGFVVAPHHGAAIEQGTHVILHIAEKCKEYLEERKLEDLVKMHSMFIEYPIFLQVEVEKEEEAEKKEEAGEGEAEEKMDIEEVQGDDEEDVAVEEVKEEGEAKEEPEKKKVKVLEDKHLNSQKPLWARRPNDVNNPITNEEYAAFYKALTNNWEDHFAVNHSHIEGDVELQVLLFIPKRPPFNMFEKTPKRDNIKLYVQNVLVSSDLSEAAAEWMSFVHGVIGSKDLPINVSREVLQGKNVMKLIKRVLTKKVVEMIKDLVDKEEDYKKFYENFANCIKLAVYHEKGDLSQKMAKFLRYHSTKSGDKQVSLDEYIARMKPEQKQIYVITGMRKEDVVASPFLEAFADYEVLFMYDPLDEFVIQSLSKYENFELQRITSEGVEIPGDKKVEEDVVKSHEDFLKAVKDILGDRVDKVVLSSHLKKGACTVTSAKYAYSAAMEHIMRAQPMGDSNPMFSGGFMTRKNFEVNPQNTIIKILKQKFEADKEDASLKSEVQLIFETSLLECGYSVKNVSDYTSMVFNYLEKSLPKKEAEPISAQAKPCEAMEVEVEGQ